jgi:hypothetical protein
MMGGSLLLLCCQVATSIADDVPTWAEMRGMMDEVAEKLADSRPNHDWTIQELSSRGNGRLVSGSSP